MPKEMKAWERLDCSEGRDKDSACKEAGAPENREGNREKTP
jgi:hypothetical protein